MSKVGFLHGNVFQCHAVLNEKSVRELSRDAAAVYRTPGIMHPDSITGEVLLYVKRERVRVT